MSIREVNDEELESIEIAIRDREREIVNLERKRDELIDRIRRDSTGEEGS